MAGTMAAAQLLEFLLGDALQRLAEMGTPLELTCGADCYVVRVERAAAHCDTDIGGSEPEVQPVARSKRKKGGASRRPPVDAQRHSVLSDSPFCTVEETARLLRSTPRAVYARNARGQLPGVVKDGRRILVHRNELLEWLKRRAVSPMEHRR